MANIRTYKLQTFQNKTKSNEIYKLRSGYKKYYKTCISNHYKSYLMTGRISQYIATKHDKSALSERYKRQVVQQSAGQMQSWISNRENRLRDIVNSCDNLSNAQKRKLHLIRIYKIKTAKTLTIKSKESKKEEEIKITYEDIILYKAISRSVKWKLPSSKNISMQLNNNTCKLIIKKEKNKKQKAKSFEYWIELSTLSKRKKIFIPVKINRYVEKQLKSGQLLNSIRIDFKDKKIYFNIMIDKDVVESEVSVKSTFKIEKLGIDFGIKHLFSLSTGQIFGVNFGKQLSEFDRKINTLQKRLQKQNIKPNLSKRYRNLVAKCKAFIKNEINRNLNKIIKTIRPKEIILENLDFRGSKLSKSMNRILRKCGRSVIKSKLAMLVKDYKITVTEVNPAYSSQECDRCGFVSRHNRKKRDKFQCKLCNYKKHADINASRTLKARSSCQILKRKFGKRTIKAQLFNNFKQCFQCDESLKRFISPDRRAVFFELNPSSFDEFTVLLKRNKQKMTKIQ